jgi:signal transduction histidine kinase
MRGTFFYADATMQFLKPIKIGKTQVRLCVNDSDFLAIIQAFGAAGVPGRDDARSPSKQWLSLLVQCPTLLITAQSIVPTGDAKAGNLCQLAKTVGLGADRLFAAAGPASATNPLVARRMQKLTKKYLKTFAEIRSVRNASKQDLQTELLFVLANMVSTVSSKSKKKSATFIESIFDGFDFVVGTKTEVSEFDDAACGATILQLFESKQLATIWKRWGSDGFLMPELAIKVWQNAVDLVHLRENFDQQLMEKKLAAMKQLAYGASHEINNPLGNIASRAQMLASRQEDSELKRQLSTIYQQAMRAHEMISDMMLYAHPPALVVDKVSWNDIFESAITAAGIDQARLKIEDCSQDVPFAGDREKLIEMLRAVLQNAFEAAPDATPVTMAIEIADLNQFRIVIENACDEMSPHIAEHLFDPFFSGREAGRGLGFGLSKACRIAEMHGGNISFSTENDSMMKIQIKLGRAGADD